ncbi:MAG: glycosyl hydrolase family 65 protein, partial [Desulforhabdus sp.]|nr:glycosyl hydrolase family 65 protein [Desulforhabdus sp.]
GLRDNTYTNIMVSWLLTRALELLDREGDKLSALRQRLQLSDSEIAEWEKISRHLHIVISEDGILAQYDGYFDLQELDWEAYRKKYGNIYRMDRLLKAEGSSPDAYKVAKQADVLMAFYNLGEAGTAAVLKRLGYNIPIEKLRKNFDYYLPRTSHGSTLSRLVHGVVAAMFGDQELAWELYSEALASDFQDIQGGTTAEGIHLGVMSGSVLATMNIYGGLNTSGEFLKLKPCLPSQWSRLAFRLKFQGDLYLIEIAKGVVKVGITCLVNKRVVVEVNGVAHEISDGQTATFGPSGLTIQDPQVHASCCDRHAHKNCYVR